MNNRESVSVNPATEDLQKAFTLLLCPETQRIMTLLSQSVRPTVELTTDSIIIHDLPTELNYDDLDNSFVGMICHATKNLYCDGDRLGKREAKAKRRKQQPLENDSVHMCVAYVPCLRKQANGEYQDAIIRFLVSNTENESSRFIEHFDRSIISDKELAEFKRENRLISNKRGIVTTWRGMNDEEIATHFTAFVGTCFHEIQDKFNELYDWFADSATMAGNLA